LGYNPVQHLVGPSVLSHLSTAQQATLTGRSFFPSLIATPFRSGLNAALDFAIVASLLAAAASWTRGGRDVSGEASAWERAERTEVLDNGDHRDVGDEAAFTTNGTNQMSTTNAQITIFTPDEVGL
jgi:hypothetical protein